MFPEQCRAARAWLSWSQAELAAKAGVSTSTIRNYEVGKRVPHGNNLRAIRLAFEQAGMWFASDGASIGFRRPRKKSRRTE